MLKIHPGAGRKHPIRQGTCSGVSTMKIYRVVLSCALLSGIILAQTGNAARVRHAAFNDGQLEREPLHAQMIRLDDHVERLGLNDLPCRFVKVDIEGHEPSFFDGAAVFLKKHRPLMLAEVNPVWLARNQFGVGMKQK